MRTRALDDATLTIPKGMFGLFGPNGSGKPTLMRCIAIRRHRVIAAPERLRALLGYLPQEFGVYNCEMTSALVDEPTPNHWADLQK